MARQVEQQQVVGLALGEQFLYPGLHPVGQLVVDDVNLGVTDLRVAKDRGQ